MSEHVGVFKVKIQVESCKAVIKGDIFENGDKTYTARVCDGQGKLFDDPNPSVAAMKAVTNYIT